MRIHNPSSAKYGSTVSCLLVVLLGTITGTVHAQNAALTLAPPSVIFEALALNHDIATKKKPKYRSPTALLPSPDGKRMYIAEQTAKRIAVYNLETKSLEKPILLPNEVTGIAQSPDGSMLYATCGSDIWPEGMVCVVDVASGKVTHRISDGIGFMPRSPVLSPDGLKLYVCNRFSNSLSVINTTTQSVNNTVALPREPYASAITPDGKRLIIGNLISRDRATDSASTACEVTFFDTENDKVLSNLRLNRGSTLLLGVAISPDAKYCFVTHLISKFRLIGATSAGGWLHTNNISILDIDSMTTVNSVSLDYATQGMANPWGIQFATEGFPPDSSFLLIAHSGGSRISKILYKPFIENVLTATGQGMDLQQKFVYLLEDVRSIDTTRLENTRALAVIGRKVFTAGYFDDENPVMGEYPICLHNSGAVYPEPVYHTIGNTVTTNAARLGERYFYDAKLCAQEWQSCQSCHPFERTDGFNWNMNGTVVGSLKNTKSLTYSWWTLPATWNPGRMMHPDMAIRSAIEIELFRTPAESLALQFDTFFMYMKPAASPYLEKGHLSESAQRGKQLFHDSEKGGCRMCHNGPLFFDKKVYYVGVEDIFDQGPMNTPHLAETWRTAPYSHLGSLLNVNEILNIDAHTGIPKKIAEGTMTAAQIDDLVAYVLSL